MSTSILKKQDSEYSRQMSELVDALSKHEENIELHVEHHFAHGTYTRELHIPAGAAAVGKIHRHSCINILAKGSVVAVTPEGKKKVSAPHCFVSGPGVQKAVYAIEDSVWINVHPWEGPEDLDLIEQQVIAPSIDELTHDAQEHEELN